MLELFRTVFGNRRTVLLLGAAVGLTIVADPMITRLLSLRDYPYLFSALLLLTMAGGAVAIALQDRLLDKRFQIALLLVIIGLQATSIQAGIDVGEASIAIMIPLILIGVMSGKDRKFLITPLCFIAAFFFIVIFASLAKDFNPVAIRKEIKAVVIFLLVLNLLHWSKLYRWYAHWFIIITTCSAAFAIVQEIVYVTLGELLVGNINPSSLRRMFEEAPYGQHFRVPALTNGYREFGLILSLSISLLVGRLLYERACRNRVWFFALFLNVSAVVLTLSKDIYLGLTVGLLTTLLGYRPKLLWPAGAITLLAAAIVSLYLTMAPGGWASTSDLVKLIPGLERERMQLDREGIEGMVISRDFLLGAGVNATRQYTDHFLGWKAHNAFILVANAGGLPALAIYVTAFLWLAYRLILINQIAATAEELALARGLMMFFLVTFIALQFTSEYIEAAFWMFAALVEASAIHYCRRTAPLAGQPAAAGAQRA